MTSSQNCFNRSTNTGIFHEIIDGLLHRKDWKEAIKIKIGTVGAGTSNAIGANLDVPCPEIAILAVINGTLSLH
jgi:diacylglycerol kinase family enzyme